ncbi:MAG: hypothetical protein PGN34_18025 [Methylobacterium frigidaeris]
MPAANMPPAMTVRLARLRRLLLLGSVLLLLFALALMLGTVPSEDRVQVVMPRWTGHIATVGLVLLVLSQLVAVTTRRGWRRLLPVVALGLAAPAIVLVLGFLSVNAQRVEIDRVTLPNGRIVMMTLEPGMTDAIYKLWEPHGWRWRSLFDAARHITYSEDFSFTTDPGVVASADGRHLLIRRGGIWTDCWRVEAAGLRPCLPEIDSSPREREEWLGRSAGIAAVVGAEPSRP